MGYIMAVVCLVAGVLAPPMMPVAIIGAVVCVLLNRTHDAGVSALESATSLDEVDRAGCGGLMTLIVIGVVGLFLIFAVGGAVLGGGMP